ncbi:hypothetical protein G3N30_06040 [Microbacterium lacticum]|uniref:hypothetical protein n=1 Tax=Microbacterium lacticum TaxID=33885 RepID=UPI0018B0BF29|nr:hypothetical protein [Microbacterium lacticum]MBF9335810.1 hypothetical protein [Microbacterium lacticum]
MRRPSLFETGTPGFRERIRRMLVRVFAQDFTDRGLVVPLDPLRRIPTQRRLAQAAQDALVEEVRRARAHSSWTAIAEATGHASASAAYRAFAHRLDDKPRFPALTESVRAERRWSVNYVRLRVVRTPLREVEYARAVVDAAEAQIVRSVARARASGEPWTAIAAATGHASASAAHHAFGKRLSETQHRIGGVEDI